jgi:hypothetical protein
MNLYIHWFFLLLNATLFIISKTKALIDTYKLIFLVSGGLDKMFVLGFRMDNSNPADVTFSVVMTTQRLLLFAPGAEGIRPTQINGDDTHGTNWMGWPVMIGGHS